jgi:heavy metal translocating P-type ATPase
MTTTIEARPAESGMITVMRRYWAIPVALAVGMAGLILFAVGRPESAQWLISVYALIIASIYAWRMVRKLLHGHLGVDLLALAAIVSTVIVAEYWASLVIVLMLAGGQALEDYAGRRATRELSALLARAPVTAHRLGVDGSVIDVPIDDVSRGDALVVRPGEVVPVDGTLISSFGSFDESSITGESLPVEHSTGSLILSGSVNGDQAVTMRATEVAAESQYQHIVALVQSAASSRAPMVRLADLYAVPFTAVAFAIAAAAWLLSGDAVRFAEVLVVATPCPLLIAAPVAFIAGMGRTARSGIIVKNGGVLERLSRVKTAAFDKTGTLTYGTPVVVAIHTANQISERVLLGLVASAEQYSSHILAATLVCAATERDYPIQPATHVTETTANGVTATVGGRQIVVGKRSFIGSEIDGDLAVAEGVGRMAVYVAIDGRYAGCIVLADRVRDNAAETLAQLSRLGIRRTLMLTGDQAATANTIAAQLAITDVRADCLPDAKVATVQNIADRPVMMVGDGVNDAPVLAAADIGVAMGAKGSTAASESADVVIMLDDISLIARTVVIAKHTTRIARQAILSGMVLSVGLMLVATLGVLPAVAGAVLQEAVDLFTILYALRAVAERSESLSQTVTSVTCRGRTTSTGHRA